MFPIKSKMETHEYPNENLFSEKPYPVQTYATSKFREGKNLEKQKEYNLETESQFPQKMSKEGFIVSETSNPNKIDQILSKAKSLQNKLNTFQYDNTTKPSPDQTNFFQTFQTKPEDWGGPTLFDNFSGENKMVEYPIEKIGDIITNKKNLSPELELQ